MEFRGAFHSFTAPMLETVDKKLICGQGEIVFHFPAERMLAAESRRLSGQPRQFPQVAVDDHLAGIIVSLTLAGLPSLAERDSPLPSCTFMKSGSNHWPNWTSSQA